MKYPIIATKMIKRTRYEVLFDSKLYWIAKINPKGIVKFIQPYKSIDAARRGLEKVGE